MTFRPYPGLTVACVLMFALLCGLGVWQLERLSWKLDLIARVNSHMAAPPVPLGRLLAMGPDESQYRRVTLTGHFDHAQEAYVFATDALGAPVYHVLTPFHTDDGRVLMVDRGAVPEDRQVVGGLDREVRHRCLLKQETPARWPGCLKEDPTAKAIGSG